MCKFLLITIMPLRFLARKVVGKELENIAYVLVFIETQGKGASFLPFEKHEHSDRTSPVCQGGYALVALP